MVFNLFITIGPKSCGKTTWIKNKLIPELSKSSESIKYISSDDVRSELLGDDCHNEQKIREASNITNSMIVSKIEAFMSFPINTHYIIFDSCGLNISLIENLKYVCNKMCYEIEFIFFDLHRSDYYKFTDIKSSKMVDNQLLKIRNEILPVLGKYSKSKIRVRSLEGDFEYDDKCLHSYKSRLLPNENNYFIIGDVHGCYDELVLLLRKAGFKITDGKIIPANKNEKILFIGDIVDKGDKTKEVLKLILDNIDMIYIVRGNHEEKNYKFIQKRKENKFIEKDEYVQKYSDYKLFMDDSEAENMFIKVYEKSELYYQYESKWLKFYATHVPCKLQYIGKPTRTEQTNINIECSDMSYSEMYDCLFKEGILNVEENKLLPYNIFGHYSFKNIYLNRNDHRIGIDTGCVFGNMLTGIWFGATNRYPIAMQVNSIKDCKDDTRLIDIPENIDMDEDKAKRISYIINNKINYISGTVCPAPTDTSAMCLESLPMALETFYNAFEIDKAENRIITLQTKYMGSRCNLYLHKSDNKKSYANSRNGYKINSIDFTDIFDKLRSKVEYLYDKYNCDIILFDGELMPWSALGEGLIRKSFGVVSAGLKELEVIKKFGFDEQYEDLHKKYKTSGYEKDNYSHKEKEKIYGHDYYSFKAIDEEKMFHIETDELIEYAKIYNEQLTIFGKPMNRPEYKPFSILKFINTKTKNDTLPMTHGLSETKLYEIVSDDKQLILNLWDKYENNLVKATEFFEKITVENNMEGVVIKPDIVTSTVPPYMKVRNEKYLSIIYGYDYKNPKIYERLVNSKHIRGKYDSAINEYKLGKQMLNINYCSLESNEYKKLLKRFIFEEEKEKNYDPRL